MTATIKDLIPLSAIQLGIAIVNSMSLVINVLIANLDIMVFLTAKVITVFFSIYYLMTSYLLACDCNKIGSNSAEGCNSEGNCYCKTNIIGSKCSSCISGYYGFPDCKCKVYMSFYFCSSISIKRIHVFSMQLQ